MSSGTLSSAPHTDHRADADGSFYQGLIPWAWIEASTKGAVLIFTAAEIETAAVGFGMSPATAGLFGGMGGGVAQAYATMGASCPCEVLDSGA